MRYINDQRLTFTWIFIGWIAFVALPHDVSAEMFEGVDVGITNEGYPYKGSLEAPLVLLEYSDYLCPFCKRYFDTTMPELIEKYVKDGQMRMEFRHFPIPSLHPTAAKGHEAAQCAADQGPVAYWKMHHELFASQGEWSRLPDPDEFLSGTAEKIGLNMAAYAECRKAGTQQGAIDKAMADAKELGFNGTPTFQMILASTPDEAHAIVGARPAEYFNEYADALLAGKEPPKEPEQPKPELPDWAKPESLTMDAERPGQTVSGDPSYGDTDARLVIVEFTDFQCPACARHATETQPAVKEKLIDTGKVRWVTKHLPLAEHANAAAAAVAAVCAGDQERYWDMHYAIFEQQDDWAELESPDSKLVAIAVELGLDGAAFSTCLGSRQALERLLPGIYESMTVTRSTPTFVVLDGETGRPIRGRLDAEEFIKAVQLHYDTVIEADKEKADK